MNIADELSEPIQQRDTDEHKPASDLKPEQLKQSTSNSKEAEKIQELKEMKQGEGEDKIRDGGGNQELPDEKKKSSDTATAEPKDKEMEHKGINEPKEKEGEKKMENKTEADYEKMQGEGAKDKKEMFMAQAGHAPTVQSMTKVDSSTKIADDTSDEQSHDKPKKEPSKQDQESKSKKGEQTQKHSKEGMEKQEVSSSKGKTINTALMLTYIYLYNRY